MKGKTESCQQREKLLQLEPRLKQRRRPAAAFIGRTKCSTHLRVGGIFCKGGKRGLLRESENGVHDPRRNREKPCRQKGS